MLADDNNIGRQWWWKVCVDIKESETRASLRSNSIWQKEKERANKVWKSISARFPWPIELVCRTRRHMAMLASYLEFSFSNWIFDLAKFNRILSFFSTHSWISPLLRKRCRQGTLDLRCSVWSSLRPIDRRIGSRLVRWSEKSSHRSKFDSCADSR